MNKEERVAAIQFFKRRGSVPDYQVRRQDSGYFGISSKFTLYSYIDVNSRKRTIKQLVNNLFLLKQTHDYKEYLITRNEIKGGK